MGVPPAKCRPDYAKFETDNPPLVLSLEPFQATPGGNLNHLGFRLPDSAALVEVQRRLELAGISTKCETGVECCYAKQTKFWVHDPDGNLWEIYTLDEDLDHRGTGQLPSEVMPAPTSTAAAASPQSTWSHRLGHKFPQRLALLDNSVDRLDLQGTFNEQLTPAEALLIATETFRVAQPGATLHLHVLTANVPVTQAIALPGPAAAVKMVPVEQELLALLSTAGWSHVKLTFRANHPCFTLGESELRETRIECQK